MPHTASSAQPHLWVRMSSHCLYRAPVCQDQPEEVRFCLKTGREELGRTAGGNGEQAGCPHANGKAPAGWVRLGNRSRSTPPIHRARQCSPYARQQPEQQPEKNGTFQTMPSSGAAGISSLSSSPFSSSRCAPGRHRPPAPTSDLPRNMRRAHWMSCSASSISFPSILDGRFRQLQGTIHFRWNDGLPVQGCV